MTRAGAVKKALWSAMLYGRPFAVVPTFYGWDAEAECRSQPDWWAVCYPDGRAVRRDGVARGGK